MKKCNKKFVDCISECATNVLRGNVPLTTRQNTKLQRNKQSLRALSIKKTALRKKRQIIHRVSKKTVQIVLVSTSSNFHQFW